MQFFTKHVVGLLLLWILELPGRHMFYRTRFGALIGT